MTRPYRIATLVLAATAGACGLGPELEEAKPTVGVRHDYGFQNQGFQNQGFQNQGFQNQGTATGGGTTPILGFQLQSLLGPTHSTVDRVELDQGSLRIWRSTQAGSTASYAECPYGGYGFSRSCGFESAGIGTCTPGAWVNLGPTTSSCGGSCTGDPILRVCSGWSPCEPDSPQQLAAGDDSCGTLCPRVGFVCPFWGAYAVMTAPYSTWSPAYAIDLVASSGTFPAFTTLTEGSSLVGSPVVAETEDGGTIPMVIASVLPELEAYVPSAPRPHGTTYRYEVRYQSGPNWAQLCGQDDAPGIGDGQPVGLPVPGVFDRDGGFQDTSRLFTFACKTGVISKCYRWGYRPWDWTGVSGTTPKNMLYKCTRMARADYCGTGASHTRLGTLINVWDKLYPQAQLNTPALGTLFFEAGWTEGGAVCLSHKRWDDAPDDVFTCPQLQQNHGPDGGRAECNFENEVAFFGADVNLFNDSAFNHADGGS